VKNVPRSTFTTSWNVETWKHVMQNMKVLVLSVLSFGGTVSDNVWNNCWIVSVDAVWLTSELLTNQWLPNIVVTYIDPDPDSIWMSVSEADFHTSVTVSLPVPYVQEGWSLTNKLKNLIRLLHLSICINYMQSLCFGQSSVLKKIHCM